MGDQPRIILTATVNEQFDVEVSGGDCAVPDMAQCAIAVVVAGMVVADTYFQHYGVTEMGRVEGRDKLLQLAVAEFARRQSGVTAIMQTRGDEAPDDPPQGR
jgi:hypothetical protein